MNMKKMGPYVIAPIVALLIIVLLLTSRLWLPDDRSNQTDNYDQQLMAGTYYIKISQASYDTYTNTLSASLFYGANAEELPPITFFAYLDGDKNEELPMTITRTDAPEPLYTVVISELAEEYYFVSIEARTVGEDDLAAVCTISIDYRDTQKIDTSNVVYVYITPTPAPTTTPTPTQAPPP